MWLPCSVLCLLCYVNSFNIRKHWRFRWAEAWFCIHNRWWRRQRIRDQMLQWTWKGGRKADPQSGRFMFEKPYNSAWACAHIRYDFWQYWLIGWILNQYSFDNELILAIEIVRKCYAPTSILRKRLLTGPVNWGYNCNNSLSIQSSCHQMNCYSYSSQRWGSTGERERRAGEDENDDYNDDNL